MTRRIEASALSTDECAAVNEYEWISADGYSFCLPFEQCVNDRQRLVYNNTTKTLECEDSIWPICENNSTIFQSSANPHVFACAPLVQIDHVHLIACPDGYEHVGGANETVICVARHIFNRTIYVNGSGFAGSVCGLEDSSTPSCAATVGQVLQMLNASGGFVSGSIYMNGSGTPEQVCGASTDLNDPSCFVTVENVLYLINETLFGAYLEITGGSMEGPILMNGSGIPQTVCGATTDENNTSCFLVGYYVAQDLSTPGDIQGGIVLAVTNTASSTTTVQSHTEPAGLELDPGAEAYTIEFDASTQDARLRFTGDGGNVLCFGAIEVLQVEATDV